jgi:hypothetical protein
VKAAIKIFRSGRLCFRPFLFALFLVGLATTTLVAEEIRITEAKQDYCRFLRGCNLEEPENFCPADSLIEKVSFPFDSLRCSEGRKLTARGVTPKHPVVGFRLYRFLGMEHRVIYDVVDSIEISSDRLAYLLEDLPLAAKMMSQFRNEPYTAEYTNTAKTHFKGTKGKRLSGEARLISGSTQEKWLNYFGSGRVEVGFWKLRGPALMDFSFKPGPAGKKTHYQMRILVFPGNGLVNAIMNMGMFRNIVLGKIREVLADIQESARILSKLEGKELEKKGNWTAEEKKKLKAVLALP